MALHTAAGVEAAVKIRHVMIGGLPHAAAGQHHTLALIAQ